MGQLSGSLRDGGGCNRRECVPSSNLRALTKALLLLYCVPNHLGGYGSSPDFCRKRQPAAAARCGHVASFEAATMEGVSIQKMRLLRRQAKNKRSGEWDETGGYPYLSPREINADSSLLLGLMVYTIKT